MRVKISFTLCLLFFTLSAFAQDVDHYKKLDRNINYDKFCFGPSFRNIPMNLRKPAKLVQPSRVTSNPWNLGSILLADNSVLEGSIRYHINRDELEFATRDTVGVFTAGQILSFEVYNDRPRPEQDRTEDNGQKTIYLSLPHNGKDNSRKFSLFEVLVEGNTSLLRRKYVSKLFLMNNEGRITQIKRRKNRVIESFDGSHEVLRQLVERERLKMREIDHVMTLVEAYNLMVEQ